MADDNTPDDDVKPDEDPKPDGLGDAGKKALDAERKARRDAEQKAKDLESRLQAIEDKDKSEVERLTEQVATLTKERDTALSKSDKLEVAISKALDEDRASRISTAVKRLTGTTREELEADADELLPLLFPTSEDGDRETPAGKPRETLRGGGDPTEDPEPDVRSIVESIPRGF